MEPSMTPSSSSNSRSTNSGSSSSSGNFQLWDLIGTLVFHKDFKPKLLYHEDDDHDNNDNDRFGK